MRQVGTRSVLALAAVAAGGTVLATTAAIGVSIAAAPSNGAVTPIQHVVVIYGENISFDHYFGTYPTATGADGRPFTAKPGTPVVDGLTAELLTNNPNKQVGNPSASANPRRYGYNADDLLTCDQDHNYNDEQRAFDGGAMDQFPQTVGSGATSPEGNACNKNDVMNYYDGNVVTALWNYAQRYAMSDNSYSTTFGPSSPGAINLISGDTGDVDMSHKTGTVSIATAAKPNADVTPDGQNGYSLTSDAQPYWDDCSTRDAVAMQGQNIGDVLNVNGLSWGWFEGGFRPTTSYSTAAPGQPTSTFTPDQFSGKFPVPHASNQGICNAVTPVGAGLPAPLTGTGSQYGYKDDYIPHHEPFQYYASTANPHHLTLADTGESLANIGTDTQHYLSGQPQFDTPNHQYDMNDFDNLVAAITRGDLAPTALPAVSFLKAPGYQDGHAGYSDPIDEQEFVVREINALQQSPDWKSTAVVIAYDDSDGWYDHRHASFVNGSNTVADAGYCNTATTRLGIEQGRCGYGPRQPLLVISPYAKSNVVDSTETDQSSIIKFIEGNWGLSSVDTDSADAVAGSLTGMFSFPAASSHGEPYPSGQAPNKGQLLLDPLTGEPTS